MKPTILISNDDGVHAPGIKVLWEALHEANFAELIVVAPTGERSGLGSALPGTALSMFNRSIGQKGLLLGRLMALLLTV